jgi:hypothetical protein
MKSSSKFFIAFGIIFIVLFMIEYSQDEPTDWSPSFNKEEKKPFGNFLLFEALPDIFKNQKIETVNTSIIDRLNEIQDKPSKVNYIFIDDEVSLNEYEADALLDFVNNGNNVFMASNRFSDTMLNSLALKEKSYDDDAFFYALNDTLFHFNFCNNIKSTDSGYAILKDYSTVNSWFDSIQDNKKMLAADTGHHCILTEIKHGNGKLILCTLPYAFTNYYILKPANADFIFKTLTRLPLNEVWWDEHYKAGKNKDSPLRYILDKKSLRWAYYLSISALILFVIFMGKRRQRVIPLQDPMKNSSLEFAATIGQVYYEKGDHQNLALKKIKYFSEYVRTKFNINVAQEWHRNRAAFLEHLCNKSGRPLQEIKTLYEYITYIENTESINEKELIHLNTLIENFKTIHTTHKNKI